MTAVTGVTGPIHLTTRASNAVFAIGLEVFRVKKNGWAELRRELVTGCTSGGYDQLETSPETFEQKLRPPV